MDKREELEVELLNEKIIQLEQMVRPRIHRIEPAIRDEERVSARFILVNVPNGDEVTLRFINQNKQEISKITGNVTYGYIETEFSGPKETLWVSFDGSSNGISWCFSQEKSTNKPVDFSKFVEYFEHELFQSAYKGNLETLNKLRMQTNIIGAPDRHGFTALSYAILGGKIEAISYLLKECPDIVESTLPDGTNPLHLAVYCGNIEVIKTLLTPFENTSERNIRANLMLQRMFTQKSSSGTPMDITGQCNISFLELFSLQRKLLDATENIDWDNLPQLHFEEFSEDDA